ncbi:hypothetical protein HYALB_00010534 [Hymenoscyphus albidus]|uniref:SUR7 protein n=1 Tax=Hymenoscyphus albidus TaxID=595503 RepID=A0A9N9Q3Q4_9HELO|nr:hypothetical protein HYALB_00010534 [Hymenoscyphus albidus]
MRPIALVPLVLAIVGFTLSLLTLMAGTKPGYLEEYHIITVNTTGLGKNLISNNKKATTTSTAPASKPNSGGLSGFISGIGDDITTAIGGAVDDIQDEANKLLNEAAEEVAKKLGIKEFYSLHLMDMCEGDYKPKSPNSTIVKGASKNVTKCSNQTAMYHFDLVGPIDQKLMASPLKTNLSRLNFPDDIQEGLDALSTALNVTFVLYCIGIAAAGLVILLSLASFFSGNRLLTTINISLASISFLALLIASIAVTVVQKKATKTINKFSEKVGIEAYRGGKYLALTWTSVAVMGVAAAVCVLGCCTERRRRSREFSEKRTQRGGWWKSGRRSDEAQLRRSGV